MIPRPIIPPLELSIHRWSLRQLARMLGVRKKKRRAKESPARAHKKVSQYDRRKERSRSEQAEQSRSGRDIGPIPPVADPKRRREGESSLRRFCEIYFPNAFNLEWSQDHLTVIAKMERAIREGGLFAMAMPRGSGKTTLVEAACLWAILCGFRRFVAMIGSSEDHAEQMLDSIKSSLEDNPLLMADFPEVCVPVARLDRIPQRANGQICDGKSTRMYWGEKEVIFATIAGSKASGAIIKVAGLTGQIRGMGFQRPDGFKARPDLVICDDPQTDESARSPSQCRQREALLATAILGLAGPGKKISGFMPCTVVCADDMADRILNRDLHPSWHGERMKMVYAWPKREELWKRYAELRRASQKNGGKGEQATEFYLKNRSKMDDGARVAWAARFEDDEHGAIQHAWNLRIDRGDEAFFAEYQNEPLPPEGTEEQKLDVATIVAKVEGINRGVVPDDASHLTAYIDVQGKLLYWLVSSWSEGFGGHVVDYGAWPDQRTHYFVLRDAKRTLQAALGKGADEMAAIRNGLELLCDELLGREFVNESGATMRIGKCLIDAQWGEARDTIYDFCRRGDWASVVVPSHGEYYGAKGRTFAQHRHKRGDVTGVHWYMAKPESPAEPRHANIDTNWWKTFAAGRLALPVGQEGAITLFRADAAKHEMFAEHCCAERSELVTVRGRSVTEWALRVKGTDNHLFDCLVGSAVAAAISGVDMPGVSNRRVRKLPKIDAAYIARRFG